MQGVKINIIPSGKTVVWFILDCTSMFMELSFSNTSDSGILAASISRSLSGEFTIIGRSEIIL